MNNEMFRGLFGNPNISREYFHVYLVGKYTIPVSIAGHLLLLISFFVLGIYPLAIVNIFSIAIWVTAYIIGLRGRQFEAMFIGITEILIHAVLAIYFLGWRSGFYIYIAGVISYIFLFPSRKLTVKILFSGGLCLLYIALNIYTGHFPPVITVDPLVLTIFENYNGVILIFLIGYMSYYYSKSATKVEKALDKELGRSDALLLNILPEQIAGRLRKSEGRVTIADRYSSVTVLFADIAGFTPFSAKNPPEKIVEILNEIFSMFDILCERHGLEKIKTIGDSYMLAGGLPVECADHTERVADMALDMIDTMEKLRTENGIPLCIRIGMSEGPVVAGVIGMKKFTYDLWGDTVNTASRMESHGEIGKVHVSESVYLALREKYKFTERGEIEVKGKGKVKTYFLAGRK
jgi:class 3 adenylate cyclase